MSKCIITVGRQFGSGGGEIARKVASILGLPCYDKELIVKAAEKSGISRDVLESVDERATNSFLYSLAMSSYNGQIATMTGNEMVMSDRLFTIQSEVIRNISKEGGCVIIGRCADDILSEYDPLLRVFVYAPMEERVSRIKSAPHIIISIRERAGAYRKTMISVSKQHASGLTKRLR